VKSSRDEILSFVRVLALHHPEKIDVLITEGPPLIVEIHACREDIGDIMVKQHAIETICRSTAGLKEAQFVFKFFKV
jgi:hypothetical protein